jgi:hypothetical protein
MNEIERAAQKLDGVLLPKLKDHLGRMLADQGLDYIPIPDSSNNSGASFATFSACLAL